MGKEKKEIGKLLELLNEYERERVNHSMIDFIPYGEKSLNDLSVAQVISKKFGFIKWLVENDKIDLDEINNNHLDTEIFYKQTYGPNYGEGGYGEIGYWYKCIGLYESLLCNLAISDTPIEDLLLYLK